MKFKYTGMLLLFGVLAFLYLLINPNQVNFLPKCPFYISTGIYCPGCGSQRSAHNLLNINILMALQQNLLFVIALLIIAYHLAIKLINSIFKKKFKSFLNHSKIHFIFLIIIVVFWIFRNIPVYPFNLLAPQ